MDSLPGQLDLFGDEQEQEKKPAANSFAKADYEHYREVKKRNADMRLKRDKETDEDAASYQWNDSERAERQRQKNFERHNVHLSSNAGFNV